MSEVNEIHIDTIIHGKKFHHACQPLFDLKNWQVFGYEVLLRCEFFENPELLFKHAIAKNRLFDLDTSSILNALLMYDRSIRHTKLFVNVYPSTLIHPSFHNFLDKLGDNIQFPNRNLIFEINEAEKVSDKDSLKLKQVVTFLKAKLGYTFALDDFGKGESSLQFILELEPDYVKLDKYFSVDLSISETKQNMVKLVLDFCTNNNIQLVLEGIEDSKDLAIAKAMGIHLGQGYLLGKPSPLSELFYKEGV
jgi:EAL domain-containing protein (putative c-di-GMP-specific phosphodiesterase class I)